MTMFGVPEGTECRLIPRDTYAVSGFMRPVPFTTRKFQVFDVADMVVDPTGVSGQGLRVPGGGSQHWASTPNEHTIGGAYAQGGWYGFALDDPSSPYGGDPNSRWHAIMVPASKVEVN